MAAYQVTCITKPHVNSPHEHITHLGNPPQKWILTTKEVISFIDSGTHSFFVQDPYTGKRADIAVVRPNHASAYLRTHADGYYNDNLLSLNQCAL